VAITDEIIGVSQLLGARVQAALPPKVYAYECIDTQRHENFFYKSKAF